jgi:hypothetical protein
MKKNTSYGQNVVKLPYILFLMESDLRPSSNCPISANYIAALPLFDRLESLNASASHYAANYFSFLNVTRIVVTLQNKTQFEF